MENGPDSTDKNLEEFVDFIVQSLPPTLSDFYGAKLPKIHLSKSKRAKLIKELKEKLGKTKENLGRFHCPFANRAEWVAGLDVLDEALKPWLDESRKKNSHCRFNQTVPLLSN